eukprot:TRINITY_DN112936_c0_g1_i1.p1 TRINITY_DN112936_c0_g1~~TRINITY_DN112936_c0_g1_i1.p1  ORF type:complete len:242 (-),score=48.09 TRINITY_DN112936_c0_g1_i1:45-770(-)
MAEDAFCTPTAKRHRAVNLISDDEGPGDTLPGNGSNAVQEGVLREGSTASVLQVLELSYLAQRISHVDPKAQGQAQPRPTLPLQDTLVVIDDTLTPQNDDAAENCFGSMPDRQPQSDCEAEASLGSMPPDRQPQFDSHDPPDHGPSSQTECEPTQSDSSDCTPTETEWTPTELQNSDVEPEPVSRCGTPSAAMSHAHGCQHGDSYPSRAGLPSPNLWRHRASSYGSFPETVTYEDDTGQHI